MSPPKPTTNDRIEALSASFFALEQRQREMILMLAEIRGMLVRALERKA